MLTKQSHVAINQFLPLIHKMKGNLQVLYDHLQQFEPKFVKISDQTTKKKISLNSLSHEQFIDEHLKKDITKILKLKKTVICELIMSPNEEQIPKAVNRRDPITGKSMPAKLEDMYPFLSKDELSSNNLD